MLRRFVLLFAYILKEEVSGARWAGILLVCVGSVLVTLGQSGLLCMRE